MRRHRSALAAAEAVLAEPDARRLLETPDARPRGARGRAPGRGHRARARRGRPPGRRSAGRPRVARLAAELAGGPRRLGAGARAARAGDVGVGVRRGQGRRQPPADAAVGLRPRLPALPGRRRRQRPARRDERPALLPRARRPARRRRVARRPEPASSATTGRASAATRRPCPAARRSWSPSPSRSAWPTWSPTRPAAPTSATLFVDEGFGSLDAETLDDVLDILDTLRENGRAVGVVSHVAEMRDRIPTQLVVRKARTGSTASRISLLTPARFGRMPGLDPGFTALPYRALGDAALAAGPRARRDATPTSASSASATRTCAVRDGALQGAARRRGPRLRRPGRSTAAPGASPPASRLTADEAVRVAETAVAVAQVAAAMTTRARSSSPPSRCTTTSPGSRRTTMDPFEVPLADKAALLVDWTERLRAARRRRPRHRRACCQVAGEQVLRRPRRHPHHPAAGPAAARRSRRWAPTSAAASSTRCAPSPRRSAAAGSTSSAGRRRLGLGRRARRGARAARREARGAERSRPARYDLVIHPSNLWLTIHESIGHATELDRALGYEANYAGTSFATLDQLGTLQYGSPVMHVTGDRTVEHGLATIGYDDEGVADPELGHRQGRRPGRLPARPADGATCSPSSTTAGPTAAPTPTPPATSRSSGWPTSRCSPAPTARRTDDLIGRVERGLYVVGDKSWSIDMQRYNFQFTGQRFYAIRDGELAGQVRDVAYQATTTDFWGSMEAVGGPDDLGARRRVQLRQGPARAGRVGQPRLPDRAVPRRPHPQHRPTRRATDDRPRPPPPQELVEHALAASTADDCVVIVHDTTSANLRWANNTLTTNGVMRARRRHRDLVRPAGRRHRRRARCPAAPRPPSRSTALVAAADARGPRRRARPRTPHELVAGDGRRRLGRRRPARPTSTSSTPSPRRSARRSAGPRPSDRILYGFVDHDVTTTYLGVLDRPAAAARAADRPLRLHRQDRRPDQQRLGRRRDPRLRRRRRRSRWRPSSSSGSAGRARQVDLPAGRYDTILPPTAVADLMIDAYWYAGARDAHDGQSVFSRRGGGTRIGEQLAAPGVTPVLRPGVPRARVRAVRRRASPRATTTSVFDNGLPLGRTDWITRRHARPRCCRPAHTAGLTGQPVTPAIDNLVARGRRRDRRRSTTSSPAPSAACC